MLIWTSIYIRQEIDSKTSYELNLIKNTLIRLVNEQASGVSMS